VTYGPLAGTLRLPGRLSVESAVRIGSGPGLVTAVPAAVGARVRKGQVLARLDDAEQRAAVGAADAQLASAELLALRAERELLGELQGRGADGWLPELPGGDELLDGRAGDAQLEYLHNAAQVAHREQTSALARKLLARRLVRSPIDGVVLARNIEAGESIPASPPAQPLFVIGSDPKRLLLDVEIDERYLQAVLPAPASFAVPAYGSYAFSAIIRQVAPSQGANRSPAPYLVTLEVPNADGALQPGMTAVVELPMGTRADTLSIPTSALSRRGESAVAWLPDEHGQPAPVPVRIGVANAALTEIEGSGFAAGRLVVTDRSPSTCLVSPAGDHGQ
jgi:HlyD family secretion protein